MRSLAAPAAAAAALLAAAALFTPASASAQQPLQPVRVVETTRADALHATALRLDGDMRRYRKAASMHMRSAEMRAATDPQAVKCMELAGFLLYYVGDLDRAQDALTGAGDRAAALGDVLNEAESYVNAAYVAQEQRRPAEAVALGRRAQLLASSPLLTDTQRVAITARLQFADSPAREGPTVATLRVAPTAPAPRR